MSTIQAFNGMLKTFMEELSAVFPEEVQLNLFVQGFDSLVALDPNKPLDLFVGSVAPHSDLVMAKDPALFQHLKLPGGVDFAAMWNSDISDATRDAIWQHINLLFLLGTTVKSMPPEVLESIETVAKNCAEQVQNGQLDFSALTGMLMNGGLANLGGLVGGNTNLAGLAGLAGLALNDDAEDDGTPTLEPPRQATAPHTTTHSHRRRHAVKGRSSHPARPHRRA